MRLPAGVSALVPNAEIRGSCINGVLREWVKRVSFSIMVACSISSRVTHSFLVPVCDEYIVTVLNFFPFLRHARIMRADFRWCS